MRERRHRARFALESLEHSRHARHRIGKDFDGDVAVQSAVARTPHFAHAAGTERREDLVWAETRSGREQGQMISRRSGS